MSLSVDVSRFANDGSPKVSRMVVRLADIKNSSRVNPFRAIAYESLFKRDSKHSYWIEMDPFVIVCVSL